MLNLEVYIANYLRHSTLRTLNWHKDQRVRTTRQNVTRDHTDMKYLKILQIRVHFKYSTSLKVLQMALNEIGFLLIC